MERRDCQDRGCEQLRRFPYRLEVWMGLLEANPKVVIQGCVEAVRILFSETTLNY